MKPLAFYTQHLFYGAGLLKDVNPRTLYNIVKTYLQISRKKDPSKPTIGLIEISTYCQEDCIGCYIGEGKKDPKVIDINIAQKFIRELRRYGPIVFVLVGGEPFEDNSRDVALSIVEKNPRNSFNICSNGIYIDEKLASQLGSYNNLFLALSLDGFKESNDGRRGQNSFEAFVRASSLLRRNKVLFGVYVTLNSMNLHEVPSQAFTDFLISSGIKIVNFRRYFNDDTDMCITDDEYVQALRDLHNIALTSPIYSITPHFGNLRHPSLTQRISPIYLAKDGIIKDGRCGDSHGNIRDEPLETIISKSSFQEAVKSHGTEMDTVDGDQQQILRRVLA